MKTVIVYKTISRVELEKELKQYDKTMTIPDITWQWIESVFANWSPTIPIQTILDICSYESWRTRTVKGIKSSWEQP